LVEPDETLSGRGLGRLVSAQLCWNRGRGPADQPENRSERLVSGV